MRFIRCIVLVLLALNLPGWAFAAMPACSMDAPSMASPSMVSLSMEHAAMADAEAVHAAHCCAAGQSTDDQPAGTACQDGAHCQCGTLYQAAQPLHAAVVPAAPDIAQPPLFPVITASALPHWRPPTPA